MLTRVTAALWLGLAVPLLQGGVVAYSQFEPAHPAADSSGNNNTFSLGKVTTEADKATAAPGAQSAVFKGSAPTISRQQVSPNFKTDFS